MIPHLPLIAGDSALHLEGWSRWGLVLPTHVMEGRGGVDGLTIQQTALTIATRETRIIGMAERWPDVRQWESHRVAFVLNAAMRAEDLSDLVDSPARR